MRKFALSLWLGAAVCTAAQPALADSTVCSDAAWNRYGYGVKATMQIEVGKGDPDRLGSLFEDYASHAGMSYSGAGGFTPRTGRKTFTHILQSESVDTAIEISMDSEHRAANVTISTFSYTCGATEDWRPYWRKFRSFLKEKHFKRLPAHSPLGD